MNKEELGNFNYILIKNIFINFFKTRLGSSRGGFNLEKILNALIKNGIN